MFGLVKGCLAHAGRPVIGYSTKTATLSGSFLSATGSGPCTAGLSPGDHDEMDVKLFETNDSVSGPWVENDHFTTNTLTTTTSWVYWDPSYT